MSEAPSSRPSPATTEMAVIQEWAETAQNKPSELRTKIQNATLDQLNELARMILEVRRAPVYPDAQNAIRERAEQLNDSKKLETSLEKLQGRVYLLRLLEIHPPTKEEASNLDSWVAQPLRWLAEKTDGVPVLGFLTGFAKNLKGRDIERAFYSSLSHLAKLQNLPAQVLWFIPLGTALTHLGRLGERKVAEMDIRDTIDRIRLAGENISFEGLASAEWDQWLAHVAEKTQKKEAVSPIGTYVEYYISKIRGRRDMTGGHLAEIKVTMAEILKPEEQQKKLDEAIRKRKEEDIIATWGGPERIVKVTFGQIVNARKDGDKWSVTVPESSLDNTGKPTTAETRLLQAIMGKATAASEITIVTAQERHEIDLEKQSLKLGTDFNADRTEQINRVIMGGKNGRLSQIVLATPGEMETNVLQGRFENGTLYVCAYPDKALLLDSLLKIKSLDFSGTPQNQLFEFRNGTWTEKAPALSARTT